MTGGGNQSWPRIFMYISISVHTLKQVSGNQWRSEGRDPFRGGLGL